MAHTSNVTVGLALGAELGAFRQTQEQRRRRSSCRQNVSARGGALTALAMWQ
jgi:hypothetical protein